MILGIPWLLKENPHIDWTQASVVVNKDYQWISLPLAKPRQSNPIHLANEISTSQANQLLTRTEVERAFLGIIRLVEEEWHGCTRGVHDYAEAKVGPGTTIFNLCGPRGIR